MRKPMLGFSTSHGLSEDLAYAWISTRFAQNKSILNSTSECPEQWQASRQLSQHRTLPFTPARSHHWEAAAQAGGLEPRLKPTNPNRRCRQPRQLSNCCTKHSPQDVLMKYLELQISKPFIVAKYINKMYHFNCFYRCSPVALSTHTAGQPSPPSSSQNCNSARGKHSPPYPLPGPPHPAFYLLSRNPTMLGTSRGSTKHLSFVPGFFHRTQSARGGSVLQQVSD